MAQYFIDDYFFSLVYSIIEFDLQLLTSYFFNKTLLRILYILQLRNYIYKFFLLINKLSGSVC